MIVHLAHQQELKELKTEKDTVIHRLESRTREGTDRVKQLEAALVMCQEEVKVYVQQFEDMRDLHHRELQSRAGEVSY